MTEEGVLKVGLKSRRSHKAGSIAMPEALPYQSLHSSSSPASGGSKSIADAE